MKKLRKLTLAALLTAAGLVVFVIEAQLPPLAAIPGIKPGLSNVFTMLGEEKLWLLSACGAMGHTLGQMAAALFIARTTALLYYLPVLMVSAIGTEIFTGLCAQLVSRRARRAGFLSK